MRLTGQPIHDVFAYEPVWLILDDETGELLQRMTRQEMTLRIETAQRIAEQDDSV